MKALKSHNRPFTALHPLTRTEEFASIIQRSRFTVNHYCRVGHINAIGRPRRIHVQEATKFGLPLEEALRLLRELRSAE